MASSKHISDADLLDSGRDPTAALDPSLDDVRAESSVDVRAVTGLKGPAHDAERDTSAESDETTDALEPLASQLGLSQEFGEVEAEDDEIEKAQARARLQAMLFGEPSEPMRMGRFVLLDRLGQGGMGVVYSAYDPQLDRRVALKLVRTRQNAAPDARERLLREAQALARLSHPNVVPVYDVGLLDGQVFIVMEFVVGRTLRAWVRDEDRDWRAVLDAYLQAGAGLAAAHRVDLVHRDFKPENAVVGDDGRIRVLDFGLARGHRSDAVHDDEGAELPESERDRAAIEADAEGASEPDGDATAGASADGQAKTRAVAFESTIVHSHVNTRDASIGGLDTKPAESEIAITRRRLDVSMTATGAVIGTPAYMSPEQFDGEKLGPETDQFSFCASLYEGLYGSRPFTGETLGELGANIKKGELPEPSRTAGVPHWVHEIVKRGLRPDPAERYPSMDALLAALQRDPAVPRRRWFVGLLVVGLIGLVAYLLATREQPAAVAVCQGGEAEIASVWNSERQAGLQATILDIERAYAKEAWPRIDQGLQRYAGDWASMHKQACLAHRRGEQSGSLLDKRMACLDKRKTALASAVDVLGETTADSLANAVEVVTKLPDIDYCSNREAMEAEIPPPEDPEVARQVEAMQKQLARARALEDAGRYSEALALVERIVISSEPLAFAPLTVEALLVQGRVALSLDQQREAMIPLESATVRGLATGLDNLALEALARRAYAAGLQSKSTSNSTDWLPWADALTKRATNGIFVRALLFNNLGAVAMSRGERDAALQFYRRALAIKDNAHHDKFIELTNIYLNLAMVTEDESKRAGLLARAHSEFAQTLGEAHPKTLLPRLIAAFWTTSLTESYERSVSVCQDYQRYHPEKHNRLASCLYRLGLLLSARGENKRAYEKFEQIKEMLQGDSRTAQVEHLFQFAGAYASFHAGHYEEAQRLFDDTLRDSEKTDQPWWLSARTAEAYLGIAISAFAAKRYTAAINALEQALPLFEKSAVFDRDAITVRQLANTRELLAKSLWNAGRRGAEEQTRIRALLAAADAWYRQAGRGDEERVAGLASWLEERGIEATLQ